jgi:hypothetical protein
MSTCLEYHEIAARITLEDYDSLLLMIGLDASKIHQEVFNTNKRKLIMTTTNENIDEFSRLLSTGLVRVSWTNEDQICFTVTGLGFRFIGNRENCDIIYNEL